ncbi:MAG TPA: hypothetical protein DEA05_14740 [Rhodobacteraceae bacterium]|nr:hypothetical protein [Paracoccaceae bacterium]
MRATRIWAALAVCAGMAACGDTVEQQALYGAGAGLGTALVLDGNPLTGLALGAAGNTLYCQLGAGNCN